MELNYYDKVKIISGFYTNKIGIFSGENHLNYLIELVDSPYITILIDKKNVDNLIIKL